MEQRPRPDWEDRLQKLARQFPYPPTPDLTHRIPRRWAAPTGRRRWAWALGILALLLGILLVSPVRASLLEFLQLGAVRIRFLPITSTSMPAPIPSPTLIGTFPAPISTASPERTGLDLKGETTLEAAQAHVPFRIRLPTYPPDLGRPDWVFLQDWGGPVVILVWRDPARPDRARLALFQIGPGAFVEKFAPQVLTATTVYGRPALWAEGPYLMQTRSGRWELMRLVEGHVLLWTEGEITYRLETITGMEEAVRIAESLSP